MQKVDNKIKMLFCCILVLLVSYFTYFHNYYKPVGAFYDEHYDIVDAERYIYRIASFDTNPPLGKMFIALGEKIFNPNKDVDIKTQLEKGSILFKTVGSEFSFVGVRFFPALFGFLNGLIIFLIFFRISRNELFSMMFSSLYLFENSTIVHLRGAMLDSTLVFFSLLTILYFIYLREREKEKTPINYLVLGCLTGLAVSSKIVGMVLVLLPIFLSVKYFRELNRMFRFLVSYVFGLCLVFFLVYYVHIVLGSHILSNEITDKNVKGSITGASSEYVKMTKNNEIYNPLKLFIPLRDHFRYISTTQSLMPKKDSLNLGSSPIGWPIGIKNIRYTILKNIENYKSSYLEFQGNPVNWTLGLLAVLLSVCLILARNIFNIRISNKRTYDYIFIFSSLYIGYMLFSIVVASTRVMYIHLYLTPLLYSFILFFLMFNYVFEEQIIKRDVLLTVSAFLLVGQIFYVYVYTSPMTYGRQISYLECEKIRIVDYWEDICSR